MDYASLLIQKMPNKLDKVFFTNSEASQTIRAALEIIYKIRKIVLDGASGH